MNDAEFQAAFSSATRASVVARAIEIGIAQLADDPNLADIEPRPDADGIAAGGTVYWTDGSEIYASVHWNPHGVIAVSYGIYGEGPKRDIPAVALADAPAELAPLVESIRLVHDDVAGAFWITEAARWLRDAPRPRGTKTDPLLHPLMESGPVEVAGETNEELGAILPALARRILDGGGIIEEDELATLSAARGHERAVLLPLLAAVGLRPR